MFSFFLQTPEINDCGNPDFDADVWVKVGFPFNSSWLLLHVIEVRFLGKFTRDKDFCREMQEKLHSEFLTFEWQQTAALVLWLQRSCIWPHFSYLFSAQFLYVNILHVECIFSTFEVLNLNRRVNVHFCYLNFYSFFDLRFFNVFFWKKSILFLKSLSQNLPG